MAMLVAASLILINLILFTTSHGPAWPASPLIVCDDEFFAGFVMEAMEFITRQRNMARLLNTRLDQAF
ncbi:MAG: hypothetical protein J0L51_08215 [Rhizobiales bacterium]|nr:hypothetical protein [Hyphomicrobiales bacterium]